MRDQLGADSSRDGRVGGPAFHFRWSPRSLSGPQGPRERDGGRGHGAGSGRGGAAAAAGLSEPVPGQRGAAAARLPAAAGLTEPARGRAGEGPDPYVGAVPAAARAASLGLTAPPASFRGEAASPGTKPGTPPRALPPCPGCRPRGGRGCWASSGTTGRAAPLSLLHYCHGRSEQCNNERASVRRGAARAGDEPVTACGDGTSPYPAPESHLNGGKGGFGCATFFV